MSDNSNNVRGIPFRDTLRHAKSSLFMLRCGNCGFRKFVSNHNEIGLKEVNTCVTCGGLKRYKCPGCGNLIKATRVEVQSPQQEEKPSYFDDQFEDKEDFKGKNNYFNK